MKIKFSIFFILIVKKLQTKFLLPFFGFLLIAINSFGQDDVVNQTKPIVEEGRRLYRSEMASWYGTDIFLEKIKDKSKIGGYFSYPHNNMENCVFFSRGDSQTVIGTISFDSSYNTQTAQSDLTERNFTQEEKDLFEIRSFSLKIMKDDTLFKRYKNFNFNLIPVITHNERKVYVLTGPTENNVVVFGNDYLLTFNNKNELTSKRALHKNIISIKYDAKATGDQKEIASIHTHLPETGEFITATDICTLMLYEKFTGWEWHYVFSENYVSMWNCGTNQLLTLTKKAFEKIANQK